MTTAMSHLSAVLVGEESVWGTSVARELAIPALSESLQVDEGFYVSGAMRAAPSEQVAVPGLRAVSGGVTLEPNAVALGRLMRGVFATRSSAALAGTLSGAPTTSISTGGTLVNDATYRYKVSAVVQHNVDGTLRVLAASPEKAQTVTTTDKIVTVGLAAPSAVPARHTHVGYVVWRTAANGGTGTQGFLTYVSGAGTTSYVDNGDATLDATITPPSQVYVHTYTRGTGDPASFSMEVVKANGDSELITGAMLNSLSMGWQSEGPITAELDLLAQDLVAATSSVPAFSLAAEPFMGHRTLTYLANNGSTVSSFSLATQVSLEVNNNLNGRRYLANTRLLSTIKPGLHQVTGQFMREYDDTDMLDDVIDNQAKALMFETFANGVASWSKGVSGGLTLYPWAYQIEADLPKVHLTTHQASSSGQDAIVQTVGLQAVLDSSAGYTLQVKVHNLTATYSAGS